MVLAGAIAVLLGLPAHGAEGQAVPASLPEGEATLHSQAKYEAVVFSLDMRARNERWSRENFGQSATALVEASKRMVELSAGQKCATGVTLAQVRAWTEVLNSAQGAFDSAADAELDRVAMALRGAPPQAFGLDDGFYIPWKGVRDEPIWAARYLLLAMEWRSGTSPSDAVVAQIMARSVELRFSCGDLGRLTEAVDVWGPFLDANGQWVAVDMLKAAIGLRSAVDVALDRAFGRRWTDVVERGNGTMATVTPMTLWAYRSLQAGDYDQH